MNKIYQIILVDEYENMYEQGYYPSLEGEAIIDINSFLSTYADEYKDITGKELKLVDGDVKEYVSTFNSCFDCSVLDVLNNREDFDDETLDQLYNCIGSIMIRGFVKDLEELKNELDYIATVIEAQKGSK